MEGKMKNHFFTLITMVLVMLFVVSLSDAQQAIFKFVDPEGAGTVHFPGDEFDINLVMDTSQFDPGSTGIWFVDVNVLITGIDGGDMVPTDPVNPFTVDAAFPNVTQSYEDGTKTLLLRAFDTISGGPDVGGDIPLATVNFTSLNGPSAVLSYEELGQSTGGTRYILRGTGAGLPPEVGDIDIPLPIAMSAFTAVPADKGVMIKWRTESELNNLGFDVYRSESLDGRFAKVNQSRIQGAGTDAIPHDYKFLDESVEVGKTYYYYIKDISYSGMEGRSDVIKVIVDRTGKLKVVGLAPPKFALLQNYPNPFNPETWIPFQLAKDASVTVRIYNLKGQPIRILELGQKEAGTYLTKDKAVYWDGRDNVGEKVASGMYFYMLKAGEFTSTRRMVIIQ
jgi:hypothetical protein